MIPPVHARRLLPITFVVLALLAFTPVRWVSWLSSFGQLMQTLVAPISHPLSQLSRSLSPSGAARDDSEAVRGLQEEVEQTKVQLLQAVAENDRLRAMIKELQRGLALDPELAVRQLSDVPVIGSAGDLADPLLVIRAGKRLEVDQGTVAMVSGLQLLGRVVNAQERTSTIAPITSKSSGGFSAVIMLNENDPTSGLACTLSPKGDGTLAGDVEDRRDPATNTAIEPKVGSEVRLSDRHWPRTAQMLLVGRVDSIEPSPKQPLRKVVTVRPTVPNLERVSEVTLRILPESDPVPAAPSRGSTKK